MTDREKKFHECAKRTLIFDNGKKILPVFLCMVDGMNFDNACYGSDGNILSSDPELRENALETVINGRSCIGCPFCRINYYFGEAVHFFKDALLAARRNKDAYPQLENVLKSRVVLGLLFPLVAKVKTRCYLSLTERDCNSIKDSIEGLSADQILKLLIDIEAFCKENNIK